MNKKEYSMKNRTKQCRVAAVLAAAVCLACVLASCGDSNEYLYIRNTQDEEINVTIEYNKRSIFPGEVVHSQTIPARATIAWAFGDTGYYRVKAYANSKPGYVYYSDMINWGGNDGERPSNDFLVIFKLGGE